MLICLAGSSTAGEKIRATAHSRLPSLPAQLASGKLSTAGKPVVCPECGFAFLLRLKKENPESSAAACTPSHRARARQRTGQQALWLGLAAGCVLLLLGFVFRLVGGRQKKDNREEAALPAPVNPVPARPRKIASSAQLLAEPARVDENWPRAGDHPRGPGLEAAADDERQLRRERRGGSGRPGWPGHARVWCRRQRYAHSQDGEVCPRRRSGPGQNV